MIRSEVTAGISITAPPLGASLVSRGALLFYTRLALTADEHRAEPPFGVRTGGEGAIKQRIEALTGVESLDLRAKPRGARASADRPGDVLAADAECAGLTVIRAEHVEMAPGESDALGEGEVGQLRPGRQTVHGLAHEPEVAEHPSGDHHAVDHSGLDPPRQEVDVLDVPAAEDRDADRLLDPADLDPVGRALVLLAAGPSVDRHRRRAGVLEGASELRSVDRRRIPPEANLDGDGNLDRLHHRSDHARGGMDVA